MFKCHRGYTQFHAHIIYHNPPLFSLLCLSSAHALSPFQHRRPLTTYTSVASMGQSYSKRRYANVREPREPGNNGMDNTHVIHVHARVSLKQH